ncbi:MAG: hypothetical protein HZA51_17240 [Planctomycetes bacterium]|nr:hypothetical protein [Planctomycetota bacterium]
MNRINRIAFAVAVVIPAFTIATASAQTTTPQQTQQVDLNAILQSLGGLGGLGGLIGNGTGTTGGTTTGGTTTGGTTTGGTTTGGATGTSTSAPSIVGNQFTTTSGGALQARSPGLFIKQAIGVQNGTVELSGEGEAVEPNFFRDTAQGVFDEILKSINDIITAINTGLGVITGLPGSGGTPTIINPATTGTGTTTPIS